MTSKRRGKRPANRFAQGGMIIGQSGWNSIGNSSGYHLASGSIQVNGAHISSGSIAVQKLKLFTAPPQPEQCKARRGGPASKIFCVVFKDVPHTVHMGAGRNRWFTWD